uniref:Hemocyanin AA6 chain n=2 Tax=Saccoglossus kowalevskii TaxID=10224 RepID=A0ABM0M6D8_SACKO|nr:PREDICTED: hemocyanin AA6 chain [Saccoglossus kowalevskii]
MDMSTHAMVPPVGEPEEIWMDYWRHDADFVDHHRHWHRVYRARGIPGTEADHLDRQGELFVYMHRQMLARYNAEREAWGLEPVEPWEFTDVDPLGSDAGDEFHNSDRNSGIRPRPAGLKWSMPDIRQFQVWTNNIRRAFRENIIQPNQGAQSALQQIRLGENNDLENPSSSSANWVGHIVEATSGTFYDNYGSLHNSGHGVFGQLGQQSGFSTYMATTAHAVRDHIFFRWHKFIDNLVEEYHQTQKTELGVDSPPVVIEENDIIISTSTHPPDGFSDWNENHWSNNNFSSDLIETTLDLPQRQFEWGKLSHNAFNYHLRIRRRGVTGQELRLTFRIFICPAQHANDRRRWIEMDKFRYILGAMETNSIITRQDVHSSVIRRFPQDAADDLEVPLARTVSGFCECGWPYNLLLPRGKADGEKYLIAVLISDNSIDSLRIRSSCGSLSYCGARDNKYPDRRQMGYPFATPISVNGQEMSVTETISSLDNFTSSAFVIKNTDRRFGDKTHHEPTSHLSDIHTDIVAWRSRSQLSLRISDEFRLSSWDGRFRLLIDGRQIIDTNAFAETGYIRLRLQGRGQGRGVYVITGVTMATRQGQTLNTSGEVYEITFNDGEPSATIPETGILTDPIQMTLIPQSDYFLTFTLQAPGVYLVGNGDTCMWRIANPRGRALDEMNWDVDEVNDQITHTRRNLYVVARILINN